MLLLLTIWLVALPLIGAVGALVVTRFRSYRALPLSERLLLSAWIGIFVLSNALLALSLLAPLSPLAGGGTLVALAGLALCSDRVREEASIALRTVTLRTSIGILALSMGCAVLGSKGVTWYDSGLYHYGVIRWLAEYGAVPGVALLHSRFGVASSWLALLAPLDSGWFAARSTTAAGGVAVFLVVALLVLAITRWANGRAAASDRFAATASLFLLPLILWMGASPTPDLAVIAVSILTAWSILRVEEVYDGRPPAAPVDIHLIPFLLALGAVSIKLSAAALLLVSGPYAVHRSSWKMRSSAVAVLAGIVVLVPAALYGWTTSGCAFYPVSALCTEAPWSVGAGTAKAETAIIGTWARWDGFAPKGAGPGDWILPWLQRHPLVTTLLALATAAALDLVHRRASYAARGLPWVLTLGVTGLVFVALSAPAPRFLLASAAVLPALWLAVRKEVGPGPAQGWPGTRGTITFAAASGGAAFLLVVATLVLTVGSRSLRGRASASQLLWPPEMHTPPELIARHGRDFRYWSPGQGDDRCWAAPLPCTPYPVRPSVRLRDPHQGFGAGFIRDPDPDARATH